MNKSETFLGLMLVHHADLGSPDIVSIWLITSKDDWDSYRFEAGKCLLSRNSDIEMAGELMVNLNSALSMLGYRVYTEEIAL